MLSTIADIPPHVIQRRRLIVLAIKAGWPIRDIKDALGLSRAAAYREIKAVRDAMARADERRAT